MENSVAKITFNRLSGVEISSQMISSQCEIIDIPINAKTIDICLNPQEKHCSNCFDVCLDQAFEASITTTDKHLKFTFLNDSNILHSFIYRVLCDTFEIPDDAVKAVVCFHDCFHISNCQAYASVNECFAI